MEGDAAEIRIRRAVPADAEELGRVHVRSWQTAYRDILPDAFLDGLDVESRVQRWRERIARPGAGEFSLVAAALEAPDQPVIVGFAGGGPERDGVTGPDSTTYDGEVYAIYLLAEWRRQHIGRQLMAASARALIDAGYKAVAIYVLKDNANARRFYEALGGVLVGEKPITIGQTALMEVIYGWPDAARLLEVASRRA